MTTDYNTLRHWFRLTNLRWSLLCVEIFLLILWTEDKALPALCWLALVGQLLQQTWSLLSSRFKLPMNNLTLSAQLVLDVGFLSCLLYATGGATNAYVSALLLPIALAGVMVSGFGVLVVLSAAILAYSGMVFWLPLDMHHVHDMQSHFVGMWINFLLSALVVVFVVAAIARELRQRDAQLAQQQMAALRQQQLLAMGTAAAQTAHDLATPIATIGLLQEELAENYPSDADIQAMSEPLNQCQQSLQDLRVLAADIRDHKSQNLAIAALSEQLVERCRLLWPQVSWLNQCDVQSGQIQADNSVLPALLNIMQNAADASVKAGEPIVDIRDEMVCLGGEQSYWQLQIQNSFQGDLAELENAGEQLMSSDNGFGMALLLSRSVIERFSGWLRVEALKHDEIQVTIALPVVEAQS